MQTTTENTNEGSGGVILTVAGSGDAFGSGGRLNTCFHVKAGDFQFLIDCGATALPGLTRYDIDIANIGLILITHLHGDHFGGLPFILLENAVRKRSKPLTIAGPQGCKERVTALLDLLYPSSTVLEKLNLEFVEYNSNELVVMGPLTVLPLPVTHTEAAMPHGLRITVNSKTLSYSGDTEWTENLVELAKDADLFICECNFYETQSRGHLTYKLLREKLSSLLCRRIILTHFDKEMLDKLRFVDLECAEDGKVIII